MPTPDSFDERVSNLRVVQFWGTVGFLAVATVGVVEAQIAYVPEHRLADRKRNDPAATQSSAANPPEPPT